MVSDTETMQSIEKKYPNLVNCLGRINLEQTKPKCRRCNYIYPCLQIRRELRRRCFAPGRYRYGFGKPMIDKKRNLLWTGDIDDL